MSLLLLSLRLLKDSAALIDQLRALLQIKKEVLGKSLVFSEKARENWLRLFLSFFREVWKDICVNLNPMVFLQQWNKKSS